MSRPTLSLSRSRPPRARRFGALGALCAGAAALGALLACPLPAQAEDAFGADDPGWQGLASFVELARAELGARRVDVGATVPWGELHAADALLLIHPLATLDVEETAAFLRAGGRIAVLDDFGRGDALLRHFRIERLPGPARPASRLRGRVTLPIAEAATDAASGGVHPLAFGSPQVALNRPSALGHPNLSPVLRVRSTDGEDAVVAVAGQVGRGRLVAMSDPSCLINEMLRYPGNRTFASNLVRYLTEDDAGSARHGRLFIAINRLSETGSFTGKPTAGQELGRRLRAAAEELQGVLEETLHGGPPPAALTVFAALLTLGLARTTLRQAARPYRHVVPRYARAAPLVCQGGPPGRLATLASASAPGGLALLELRSALGETLAPSLGLAPEAPDRKSVV